MLWHMILQVNLIINKNGHSSKSLLSGQRKYNADLHKPNLLLFDCKSIVFL